MARRAHTTLTHGPARPLLLPRGAGLFLFKELTVSAQTQALLRPRGPGARAVCSQWARWSGSSALTLHQWALAGGGGSGGYTIVDEEKRRRLHHLVVARRGSGAPSSPDSGFVTPSRGGLLFGLENLSLSTQQHSNPPSRPVTGEGGPCPSG